MTNYIKKNRLYIFTFIFCLFLFVFFALKATGLFEIISMYIFDPEYRENFTLAESTIKESISLWEVIKHVLSTYPWQFDVSIIFGTEIFQLVIPLLATVSGVTFYINRESILQMKYYRINESYRTNLCKYIIKESLFMSISIFTAYMVFYLLIYFLSNNHFNMTVTRDFLKDILGTRFYANNPYLYYFIEGLVKFLFIPFIYSFFSCSTVLVLNNRKKIILAPNLYYFGLSVIGFGLTYIIGAYSLYINPSSIMVVGSLNEINSVLIIFTSMVPFFIACILIYWGTKNVEI